MTDAKETDLRANHADLLIEIGALTLNSSLLELTLHMAFAVITKDNGPTTHAILSRVEGFAGKAGILFDVAKLHSDSEMAKAIIEAQHKVEKIIRFRNLLAQCAVGKDDDTGEIQLLPILGQLEGRSQAHPLTVDEVRLHSDLLKEVMSSLQASLPPDFALHEAPHHP